MATAAEHPLEDQFLHQTGSPLHILTVPQAPLPLNGHGHGNGQIGYGIRSRLTRAASRHLRVPLEGDHAQVRILQVQGPQIYSGTSAIASNNERYAEQVARVASPAIERSLGSSTLHQLDPYLQLLAASEWWGVRHRSPYASLRSL
jgi:hypothetical protein